MESQYVELVVYSDNEDNQVIIITLKKCEPYYEQMYRNKLDQKKMKYVMTSY